MNTRRPLSRAYGAPSIESLESRWLLSASSFGPLQVTRLDMTGEVAGIELINDSHQSGGGAVFARVDSTTITQSHLPGVIVRWGDGTRSLKTTAQYFDVGEALVSLSDSFAGPGHAYRRAGKYTMTVQLTDGHKVISTMRNVIHIGQNSLYGVSITTKLATGINGSIGRVEPISGMVANSAQIDWGDGQTSLGITTQSDATQPADVSGTHKYAKPGVYRVTARTLFVPPDDGQNHAAVVLYMNLYSTITVKR